MENNIHEDFELLEAYVHFYHLEDKYVILKEDENGRYIEYAFTDGAPHDNRCLSWYDKLQPTALERNNHKQDEWKIREVGKLYELSEFNCGRKNYDGDEHCSAGHPCKKCVEGFAKYWTYDEPVKCACWFLSQCDFKFVIPSRDLRKFYEYLNRNSNEKTT